MRSKWIASWLLGLACSVLPAVAWASTIGSEIADQVSTTSYQHYLADLLYTHLGNNRDALGGPDHDLARSNIFDALAALPRLQVELHAFSMYGAQRYNVVATQFGTKYPDSYYVIGAHYDTLGTPGADDNASGVAGVMEIARIFSNYETEYTIKYMAFDMEEEGLYGSEAYANDHVADDIRGMISLDMIAYQGGLHGCILESVYSLSYSFRLSVRSAVQQYGNGLAITLAAGYGGSDHAPFEEVGHPACLLIEGNYSSNPCYHQDCDAVETLDYIDYVYARDMTRSIAGFLADHALAHHLGDCNDNGIPDQDEILSNPALDCDGNGRLDACQLHGNQDCNTNGMPDLCDIAAGTSQDCNHNGVPDECDNWADCNGNGILDQCDIASGFSLDCNRNGVPDNCDLTSGTSRDCDVNSIPDECEFTDGGPVVAQPASGGGTALAQDFSDAGMSQYNVKEWDDFTLSTPRRLGRGQAFFFPTNWRGFGVVPFRVEVATAPGGAQAGATVLLTATGAGEAGTGIVRWDFKGAILPAGAYWISVQANGGYSTYDVVYWLRTNVGSPNSSEHYFHNPGNGFHAGSAPIPGSAYYGSPADMAFLLFDPFTGDCNKNGILDRCDIASGVSADVGGNSVPDECEDLYPPTPNPMAFEAPGGLPQPISTTAISMTAVQASDPFGVDYYFSAVGIGSHSRTWGSARSYTDTGLAVNMSYTYKVKARDRSTFRNETAYSAATSVSTLIETPAGLSFDAVTDNSIQVAAPGTFTRLDEGQSGLFFEVTKPNGQPVGGSEANSWVQVQSVTASGLAPGTTYHFRVKTRNCDGVETLWYPASNTATRSTTGAPSCQPCGDLDQDEDIDYDDYVALRTAMGRPAGLPGESPCVDFDHDGMVTIVDYQMWLECYRAYRGDPFAPPPSPGSKGDINGDGKINGEDIQAFVGVMMNQAGAGYRQQLAGDLDGDGAVEIGDVQAFVNLLISP